MAQKGSLIPVTYYITSMKDPHLCLVSCFIYKPRSPTKESQIPLFFPLIDYYPSFKRITQTMPYLHVCYFISELKMSLKWFDSRLIPLAKFLFYTTRQTGHQTKDWDLFVSMLSCLHLLWPDCWINHLSYCSVRFGSSLLVSSSEMGYNGSARTGSLSSG